MQLPFQKDLKIFTRKESNTDDSLGRSPPDRKTDEILNYGIINIDKPTGPTSHQVSAFVQDILHIGKSGHSGTLDPGVTGVLPIALGRATRIVQSLLPAGKEYIAVMHLHKEIDESVLRSTINSFVGKINQLPPIKSSVKRRVRQRTVYYLEILEIEGKDVLFKVGCQAGTYIRKICHDMGQKLGTGAHMAKLRRTRAGPFDESTLFTLQDLSDAYYFWKQDNNDKFLRKIIQPVENAIEHLPKVWVFDTTVPSLCHGIDLKVPGISKLNDRIEKDDLVAVMTLKEELVALGVSLAKSKDMLGDKGVAVKTNKVFMMPGTYSYSKGKNQS